MRLYLLSASLLLSAAVALGQTFYGTVVGTVSDSSGSAMPQANVVLINAGRGDRRTSQTDADGNYQFVNLAPGQYRVEIEKTGFRRLVRENVLVEVQSTARIDAVMQVGDVSQVLEVTAQTPLLQQPAVHG